MLLNYHKILPAYRCYVQLIGNYFIKRYALSELFILQKCKLNGGVTFGNACTRFVLYSNNAPLI